MMELNTLLHDDDLHGENGRTTTSEQNPSMLDVLRHTCHTMSNVYSTSSGNIKRAVNTAPEVTLHYFYLIVSLVPGTLLSLLPRFLRREGLQQTKKLGDTSYLDALRGWAAMVVFVSHTFPFKGHWILQLPFTHALVHGRAMVMVFFIISGYALSYRMLKLMRTRQASELLDSFISSIFRRWIRLYGSTGAATFVAMLLVWYGFCLPDNLQKTFLLQLKHWILDFAHFSYPLAKNVDGFVHSDALVSIYMGVTWTIPIEFRGSILVFLFCIGACKLSTRNRMALCWFFMICSYFYQIVYIALFLGGLFIADLSFTRHPERSDPPTPLPLTSEGTPTPQDPCIQSRREELCFATVLVIAIFLLSQPAGREVSQAYWPWPVLDSLVPTVLKGWRQREGFWLSIGSFLLVWALDACPTLQTPLRWNVSQYLGKLSFGIYVTHYLVVWAIWEPILNPLRRYCLGNAAWTLAPFFVIHLFFMLWAAELFIRVDTKVIAFARWVQRKTFVW